MDIDVSEPWQGFPYDSPRDWQAGAREACLDAIRKKVAGIVYAICGSGKSVVIAEVLHSLSTDPDESIVVTTPSVNLVDQLYDDITDRVRERAVGKYYTHASEIKPIIVCCMPSAPELGRVLDYREKSCPLLICDEAHKSECDTIHDAVDEIQPERNIGFTATPFRADDSEELSLYEELIYEYTASDAIQDGIVVPPKLVHHDDGLESLDNVCLDMIQDAIDEGPGMVNALTIEGAEDFADKLDDAGIDCDTVHSGHDKRYNNQVMEWVKNGVLDCAVHISMLAEGADFPWLRWICMRRPTKSRTRFCQEVGRVLRDHPGKDYALVLDPHDLFNSFGLDYEAVLRGDTIDKEPQKKVEDALDELRKPITDGEPPELAPGGTPVMAIDACSEWLRKVKLAFQSHGYIEDKISSTGWRTDDMSRSQRDAIKKYAALGKRLPDAHKKAGRASVKAGINCDLTKGEASDLLSILFAVKDYGWPDEIDNLVE